STGGRGHVGSVGHGSSARGEWVRNARLSVAGVDVAISVALETVRSSVHGVSSGEVREWKGEKGAGSCGFGGPREVAVVAVKGQKEKDSVFFDGAANTETVRSEEHTSELQSLAYLVCRLLLEKKKTEVKIVTHS